MLQCNDCERERPVFSASAVLQRVGGDLALIKSQDALSYADIGAVLGVSEDQAAKYCEGTATMNLVTYARGKREWAGRFTGSLNRLCGGSKKSCDTDRERECKVMRAAAVLSCALVDGGQVSASVIRENRSTFEAAFDAIGELLGKQDRGAA
jgi:hypothetical protein